MTHINCTEKTKESDTVNDIVTPGLMRKNFMTGHICPKLLKLTAENGKVHIVKLFMLIFITAICLTGCTKDGGDQKRLTIFAAASTTDVVGELIGLYENESGCTVKLNTASSGNLARQIESGAQADIFISASQKWADYADNKGLLTQKTALLGNSLVLVSSDMNASVVDLSTDTRSLVTSRIAMGDPAYVPAGKYGKEALISLKVYDEIVDKKLIIPTQNVRAALMTVELGEVDYGIVYKTDAMKSTKVKMIGEFPASSHKPIAYVFSLCKDGSPEADALFSFLTDPKNKAVYEKYGFTMTTGQ